MVTYRIGRPPTVRPARRIARWVWRHAGNPAVYWLAMTGAMVATVYGGVRLVVAVMPHAQAPLNFSEWTVAIVAVGSLVGGHLLSPRPKRRTKHAVAGGVSSPVLGGRDHSGFRLPGK